MPRARFAVIRGNYAGRMLRAALWRHARGLHTMKALPFASDAMAPMMSSRTLKRHRAHGARLVERLSSMLSGTTFEHRELQQIIAATARDPEHSAVFNHASELWSHQFYWSRLTPGGREPRSELVGWIAREFGSFESFQEQFVARANGIWGSGWTWLVLDRATDLKLRVVNSTGTTHPLSVGLVPLLGVDMWERAYWSDHAADRSAYVRAALGQADWEQVGADLLAAAEHADEHAKLKYIVRLSAREMERLRTTMVTHGTIELTEELTLGKIGLDGGIGGGGAAAEDSNLDVAIREVLGAPPAPEPATRAAGTSVGTGAAIGAEGGDSAQVDAPDEPIAQAG